METTRINQVARIMIENGVSANGPAPSAEKIKSIIAGLPDDQGELKEAVRSSVVLRGESTIGELLCRDSWSIDGNVCVASTQHGRVLTARAAFFTQFSGWSYQSGYPYQNGETDAFFQAGVEFLGDGIPAALAPLFAKKDEKIEIALEGAADSESFAIQVFGGKIADYERDFFGDDIPYMPRGEAKCTRVFDRDIRYAMGHITELTAAVQVVRKNYRGTRLFGALRRAGVNVDAANAYGVI